MRQNIKLSDNQIEKISRIIGDVLTCLKLTDIFLKMNINDISGESTKWKRINGTFSRITSEDGTSDSFFEFLKIALSPINFVNNEDKFEKSRLGINQILAFSGLELDKNGEYKSIACATTIEEVKNRLSNLKFKLERYNVHPIILEYCNDELVNKDYFHLVFEANKSLCEKIRNLTHLTSDGSKLTDEVFSTNQPYLTLNSLQTDSEKNQQKGLALMLKGIFSMVRNVTAHTPKIKWIINEDDAIDILIVISYLHKRLNECQVVRLKEDSKNG